MMRLSCASLLRLSLAPRMPFTAAAIRRISASSFSMSAAKLSAGKVDMELATKLKGELKYEMEEESGKETPAFLSAFDKQGIFKIQDKAGEKEVELTSTFGNERIKVLFSTEALTNAEMDVDQVAEGEEDGKSYPIPLTILIEKPDQGCMEMSVTLEDDSFFIDHISFSKDTKLMLGESAESDWMRRAKYGGPVFADLDEPLQNLFLEFLEERGFDSSLASFIPEYLEHKERKEYMQWLKEVGDFVSN